jgi:hypothetical protein
MSAIASLHGRVRGDLRRRELARGGRGSSLRAARRARPPVIRRRLDLSAQGAIIEVCCCVQLRCTGGPEQHHSGRCRHHRSQPGREVRTARVTDEARLSGARAPPLVQAQALAPASSSAPRNTIRSTRRGSRRARSRARARGAGGGARAARAAAAARGAARGGGHAAQPAAASRSIMRRLPAPPPAGIAQTHAPYPQPSLQYNGT